MFKKMEKLHLKIKLSPITPAYTKMKVSMIEMWGRERRSAHWDSTISSFLLSSDKEQILGSNQRTIKLLLLKQKMY